MNLPRLIAAAIFVFSFVPWVARSAELDGVISVQTSDRQTWKLEQVKVDLYDLKTLSTEMDARKKAFEPVDAYFTALCVKNLDIGSASVEQEQKHQKILDGMKDDSPDEIMKEIHRGIDLENKSNQAADYADKYQAFAMYGQSVLYNFQGLPASLQSVKTDASGRFSFQVDDGVYVLVATAHIQDNGKDKAFNWMVKAPTNGKKKNDVTLDINNQAAAREISDPKSPANDRWTPQSADSLIRCVTDEIEESIYKRMHNHDLPWLINYMQQLQKAEAADASQKGSMPSPTP